MRIRTFTFVTAAALCAATVLISRKADDLVDAAAEIVIGDARSTDCMENGIDTPTGRVGCLQPVIAIIDESFFAPDAESADVD